MIEKKFRLYLNAKRNANTGLIKKWKGLDYMQDKDLKSLGSSIQEALNIEDDDLEKIENGIQEILKDARSITNMVNRTISQYQAAMPKRAEQARMEEQRRKKRIVRLSRNVQNFQTNSILKIVFGGALTGITASGLLAGILIQLLLGSFGGLGLITLFLMTALSAWLLISGIKGVGRVSRFKKYLKKLGAKTYISFKDLGRAIGKKEEFIKDDIKYMLKKEWFEEGYIDQQESCLMTSEETYAQYQATQTRVEELQKAEQAARKDQEDLQSRLSPEVREVLQKGNVYLERIRVCNLAIPGEEMTAKISSMEQIVDQIFRRAEAHPEIIPDLKRMMDYYLPTSIKLLDAYIDMDAQTYQGEQIQKSKKEIEQTIDTLTLAFQKLLDSVFQETAWDVSSDISVLNTILSQEGLTEDGMMGAH